MRLLLQHAVHAARLGADVHQARLVYRNAEGQQGKVFGDGEVFAITASLRHAFEWCGPVIALPPDREIVIEGQALIEEIIDPADTFTFRGALDAPQQLLPVVENGFARPVEARLQLLLQTLEIQT